MAPALRGISSMATRQLLAQLCGRWNARAPFSVAFESVGGVDAARRVGAGEPFDLVVLAADAIDRLAAAGHVRAGSRVDLVRSEVAVAVRAGAPVPDVSTEASLRHAVEAAPSIGYSTGPSGTALLALFARWGLADALAGRTVQAPPGIPVGQLVAQGQVALGFQQFSELMHLPGITVAGMLPPGCAVTTVFSGAVCSTAQSPDAAAAVLGFLASAETAADKRAQGMDPA